MSNNGLAVVAEDLRKHFGATQALRGVDLAIPQGSILAVLGPNGAGKTTAVRILSTLLKADSGHAEVAGFDVAREPDEVRRRIGLTGQDAALDEFLTGRENLEMIGRLYHLPRAVVRRRALELLERFDLTDAGSRMVKTYSGGMRRRLDLAASLIAAPPVLFLDEPTTGLDPRSRLGMWDLIQELVAGGTTLLLTTQYLEEADHLAHQIAVIDHGLVIARGTADELKTQVGGERLILTLAPGSDLPAAARVLDHLAVGPLQLDEPQVRLVVPVVAASGLLTRAVRELDAIGIAVDDLQLHRPTLDDVFLTLTGHAAEDAGENGEPGEPAPEAVDERMEVGAA
ncbi:MAG TPA: ATP-binding cassette domain-containing protein [Thermomicrobiaceae bacterium]|nr:ATP-binding cassette domain-containing protein [Thermomicrobiaceae bacterium]